MRQSKRAWCRVRRWCGYGLALSAALALSEASAQAARPLNVCSAVEQRPLPDPRACLARWRADGDADADSDTDTAPDPFARLLVAADARRNAEAFAEAEQALDCAAAQPADGIDPARRYELIRRYGLIDYKRNDIAGALQHFDCALAIATERGDRPAIIKQLKNAGSARRRLGDYKTALAQSLRSLEMQEADGDPATGAVLNNIADIHRDSGRIAQAQAYYERALAAFRRSGDPVEAMHVSEMLARLALDRGDPAAASALLQAAMQTLRDAGNRKYRLRIYAGLARAATAQGEVERARAYAADGLALAAASGLSPPWELELETARADRLSGRLPAAMARMREALAPPPEGGLAEAALRREWAEGLRESGDDAGAMRELSAAHALELQDVRRQSDRQALWLWDHFEAKERERENAALRAQNRQRSLWLGLTAVSALAALLLLAMFFLRRQQHARLREAANRARYEEQIARYRRESAALADDRDLLQSVLDSRDDAICVMDADGVVLAANRAACHVLGAEREALVAQPLHARFAGETETALKAALERMEDAQPDEVVRVELGRAELAQGELAQGELMRNEIAQSETAHAGHADIGRDAASAVNGTPGSDVCIELRPWAGGDGLIMAALRTGAAHALSQARSEAATEAVYSGETSVQLSSAHKDSAALQPALEGRDESDRTDHTDHSENDDAAAETMTGYAPAITAGAGADAREAFRRSLVALMLESIETWERSTSTNRIELAERSRIWRINIGDGRLRARAMERYLTLSRLPQNPRWRDVLRTAYYVLGQCPLDTAERDRLQASIDAVLGYTRRSAML
jgi:two-component system sensor histidine kinase ChiS